MSEKQRVYDGFVPGRYAIDAYGSGGFRFAGMSHRGSVLALPSGIKAWEVRDARALMESDFADILTEAADIDFLFIGTGIDPVPVSEALRTSLKQAGIRSIEVLSTGSAARTYNILAGENRKVAAALIAVD